MKKKSTFRMLCDGEEEWRGAAFDAEHAEERCFYYEPPAASSRYTLQKWGRVKLTRQISTAGWVTVYKNQSLATA
jgi:hypothetical protein